MLRRIFLALALVAITSSVNAATVSLFMNASGGNWQLFADDTSDNGGIVSANIPLLNISTLTNEMPFYQLNATNFQPAGFSNLRLPATDGDTVGKTLFGSEQLVPTATPNLVYGFGQAAGTLSNPVSAAPNKNLSYAAHLLIGSGTYAQGQVPAVDFNAANLSIVVFSASTGTAVSAATVQPGAVPEPATLAMLGLAMVGGIGAARRRRS
jgi:hypothetical protein